MYGRELNIHKVLHKSTCIEHSRIIHNVNSIINAHMYIQPSPTQLITTVRSTLDSTIIYTHHIAKQLVGLTLGKLRLKDFIQLINNDSHCRSFLWTLISAQDNEAVQGSRPSPDLLQAV